ncbi:MAG: type II CAAX endopeptidase family protein [Eubacteriales bacterium]
MVKSDPEYQKNIERYTSKDGCFALILYAVFMLVCSGLAVCASRFLYIRENILAFGALAYGCIIGITLLLMKARKQGLSSVGLVGGRWKKSCLIGFIVSIIAFVFDGGFALIQDQFFIGIKEMAILSLYFIIIAVCEELVFRGYMGTRIYGLIKKQWIGIILIGVLFAFSHLLVRATAFNLNVFDLFLEQWIWMLELFILHIIWNYIYLKTNSLYGSIFSHWLSNLVIGLFAR